MCEWGLVTKDFLSSRRAPVLSDASADQPSESAPLDINGGQCSESRAEERDEVFPETSFEREPSLVASVSTSSHGTTLIGLASPSAPPDEAEQHFTISTTLDLELLHHFTLYTSRALAQRDDSLKIWQTAIPKTAFANPFLMHMILAAAAFHLVSTTISSFSNPDTDRYITAGIKHQQAGIAACRPFLNEIDSVNCHAISVFSIIMVYCAFNSPQCSHPSGGKDPLGDMIFNLSLIRGVLTISQSQWDSLQSGPFALILQVPKAVEQTPDTPTDVEDAFVRLSTAISSSTKLSAEEVEAYHPAVSDLKARFMDRDSPEKDHGRKFFWPMFAQKNYLDYLDRRDEFAMCIFAYYLVMLYDDRVDWAFNGWAIRIVEYIARELESMDGTEELKELVKWPMIKLGLG